MATEQLRTLWEQAVGIWLSGGWAMIALAVNALVLFMLGMHVLLKLRAKGYHSVPEKTWRHWINHPEQRRGPIGKLLDFVTGAKSLKQTAVFFEELEATEVVPFERDLRVMKVCVSAAPLLGLLGTVTGMLSTFGALATGSGGDKTMALVAKGIIFIVDERGRVVEPRVKSLTDAAFDQVALAAVKRWKFEPGKRGGKPVRFRMLQPITFPES